MLPLLFAPIGETVTIKKVGGKQDIRRHLANLGFVEGAKITVVNHSNENIIVSIKDVRVGLDQDMAKNIQV